MWSAMILQNLELQRPGKFASTFRLFSTDLHLVIMRKMGGRAEHQVKPLWILQAWKRGEAIATEKAKILHKCYWLVGGGVAVHTVAPQEMCKHPLFPKKGKRKKNPPVP